MGSAPASLADNPFLITLLLEMQTTIFLRTEMSRKTEYVHNPCFLSANILKILGVFAEKQKEYNNLVREVNQQVDSILKQNISPSAPEYHLYKTSLNKLTKNLWNNLEKRVK